MNKKLLLTWLMTGVTCVNAYELDRYDSGDFFPHTRDIYNDLSKASFQTHVMQIQNRLKHLSANNKYKFILNQGYNDSVYNVMSTMLSDIITGKDNGYIAKRSLISDNNFEFRENNTIYLPKFLAEDIKLLQNLRSSEWNYVILYNYLKKHTLELITKRGTIKLQDYATCKKGTCRLKYLDISRNKTPKKNLLKEYPNIGEERADREYQEEYKHYPSIFWDDNEAIAHVQREAKMLKQFLKENFLLNEKTEQKIDKAGYDAVMYTIACELHRYISVQNVITYKLMVAMKCLFTVPMEIKKARITKDKKDLQDPKNYNNLPTNSEKQNNQNGIINRNDGDKDGIEDEAGVHDNDVFVITKNGEGTNIVIPTPYASLNLNEYKVDDGADYILSIICGIPINRLLTRHFDKKERLTIESDISSEEFDINAVELPVNSYVYELNECIDSTFRYTPIERCIPVDKYGKFSDKSKHITIIDDDTASKYLANELNPRIDNIVEALMRTGLLKTENENGKPV